MATPSKRGASREASLHKRLGSECGRHRAVCRVDAAHTKADGFDGSRRGQSHSRGNGMTRRAVELQRDTQRSAALPTVGISKRRGGRGGGKGGVLPK